MADKELQNWTFRFHLEGFSEDESPVRVIVEGISTLLDDYYDALETARDAVMERYDIESDDRWRVVWIETADTEPDHYLGLEEVDTGIWL